MGPTRKNSTRPSLKGEKKGSVSLEEIQRCQSSPYRSQLQPNCKGPLEPPGEIPVFRKTGSNAPGGGAFSTCSLGRHGPPLPRHPHQWGFQMPPLPREQTPSLGSSIHAAPSVIMSPAFRQSQLCFLPLEGEGAQRPKTPLPFLSLQGSLHGCENNLILKESTTSLNLKLLF